MQRESGGQQVGQARANCLQQGSWAGGLNHGEAASLSRAWNCESKGSGCPHLRCYQKADSQEDKQPPQQAVIPKTVLEMNTHSAFMAYLPAVHEKPVPLTEREAGCSEYMKVHAV